MNSREANFNLANVGVVSGWVRVTTGLIRDLGWALQRNLYTERGLNGCFKPTPLCKTWICSLEQDCCVLGRGSSPHWLILLRFFYEHWFSELSHLYRLRAEKFRSQQCGSILVVLCTEFNWVSECSDFYTTWWSVDVFCYQRFCLASSRRDKLSRSWGFLVKFCCVVVNF